MIPTHRTPTHPGEILREEFLAPLGIAEGALAEHIGISAKHLSEIVCGKRGITPSLAWLLAQAFETTPEFWLNLQQAHDLALSRPGQPIPRLARAI